MRNVASYSCERARAMAEAASERASAMFSPPTTPLSRGADRGGLKSEGGWESAAARRLVSERGGASGPPTQPSRRPS
eukprot:3152597-Pleurochrysis_carterae.AAC.1